MPVGELTVDKSVDLSRASKRQATFGSLVKSGCSIAGARQRCTLKDPKDFKLIGSQPPRVDVPAKCDGTAQFTLDVAMPGMLVALLKRPPLFGGNGQVLRCGRRQRRCPAWSRWCRCRAASRWSPRVSGPPSRGATR